MDQLIEKFNLPKYLKGKTFAEASKAINKKFEGMDDKISNETKMEMLQRLADAQEYTKQVKEANMAMRSNPEMEMMGYPDMMGGNEFFLGGFMNKLLPGETGGMLDGMGGEAMGGMSGAMSKAAPFIGAASGAMDMIGSLDGDGLTGDGFTDALSGVSKGASAGMAFGPLGAGIGALAGGVTSLIGSNAAEKKRLKKERQASAKFSNNVYNDYAKGGYMNYGYGGNVNKMKSGGYSKPGKNYYQDGGPITGTRFYDDINPELAKKYAQDFANRNNLSVNFDDPESVMNAQRAMGFTGDAVDGKWGQDTMRGSMRRNPIATPKMSGYNSGENGLSETLDFPGLRPTAEAIGLEAMGPNLGEINTTPELMGRSMTGNTAMPNEASVDSGRGDSGGFNESFLRYAPVATNAFQLFSMDGPEVESLNRLGGRYDPSYVDEMTMQNIVQNQYNDTAGAIANASGGNRGALRSNILAANMNKGNQLSNAYMKAREMNRAEDTRGQQFDLGIDQFNIGQSNMEKDINARNRGAYETNKSKLISQLGNDLGDIGMEAYRRRYPELMGLDYDSRGRKINRKNNKKKRK